MKAFSEKNLGSDVTRVHFVCLLVNLTGRQSKGLQKTRRKRTGRQKTGRQSKGLQKTRRQRTGRQQTRRQMTGRQRTGRQKTRRQMTGRQKTGRQRKGLKKTRRQRTQMPKTYCRPFLEPKYLQPARLSSLMYTVQQVQVRVQKGPLHYFSEKSF